MVVQTSDSRMHRHSMHAGSAISLFLLICSMLCNELLDFLVERCLILDRCFLVLLVLVLTLTISNLLMYCFLNLVRCATSSALHSRVCDFLVSPYLLYAVQRAARLPCRKMLDTAQMLSRTPCFGTHLDDQQFADVLL